MKKCKTLSGYHASYIVFQDDIYGLNKGCKICGQEIYIKKTPWGQLVDNDKYIEFHKQDFLQGSGKDIKEYDKVYGKQQRVQNQEIRTLEKNKKQRKIDAKGQKEEIINHLKKGKTYFAA